MKWITMNQLEFGQRIYGVADILHQKVFEAPGVVYKCDNYSCGIQWPWGDFESYYDGTVFKVEEDLRSPG
jgi:hypothetical protein